MKYFVYQKYNRSAFDVVEIFLALITEHNNYNLFKGHLPSDQDIIQEYLNKRVCRKINSEISIIEALKEDEFDEIMKEDQFFDFDWVSPRTLNFADYYTFDPEDLKLVQKIIKEI